MEDDSEQPGEPESKVKLYTLSQMDQPPVFERIFGNQLARYQPSVDMTSLTEYQALACICPSFPSQIYFVLCRLVLFPPSFSQNEQEDDIDYDVDAKNFLVHSNKVAFIRRIPAWVSTAELGNQVGMAE